MRNLFLQFALSFSLVQGAFAQTTAIVTDIDDTIKVSHVVDKIDAARYLTRGLVFPGMPELLTVLGTNTNSSRLFYLSNAPLFWMGDLHSSFLRQHQFPLGQLILRDVFPAEQHKLFHLRQIRDQIRPSVMILLGDNGERDPAFYRQFVDETLRIAPDLKIYTFIHQLYSPTSINGAGSPLESDQIGFETSYDLSLLLFERGLLSSTNFEVIAENLRTRQLLDEEHFPDWINCKDYRWQVSESLTQSRPEFLRLWKDLQLRCWRLRL